MEPTVGDGWEFFAIIYMFLTLWLGYLLGSIPSGVIIARLFKLGDVRAIGSGNIGATNVLRTGSKLAAALTLLADAGKGAVAVLLASCLFGDGLGLFAGAAAFVGHCWPVWLGFKGGKGVATFLGVVLALNPMVGLLACAGWLLTALVARISSLSALVCAALTPVLAFGLGNSGQVVLFAALALVLFWRHKGNIARLLAGTEPKIGSK